MTSTNNNASSNDVPIGMQRLSCLPCRKRKSKCDRNQPCSSCVLRSTENFCYTSTAEDDPTFAVPAAKKDDKIKANNTSTNSVSATSSNRPAKVRKIGDRSESNDNSNGNKNAKVTANDSNQDDVDRSAILSAIQSIKMTLTGLETTLGHKEALNDSETVSTTIYWNDIRSWLPSREDSETILDCFFTEAIWLFTLVHSTHFMQQWKDFADGKETSRTFAALAFVIMGIGLSLAPSSHPSYSLSYKKDHKLFIERANQIIRPSSSLFYHVVETPELAQVLILICHYLALSGYPDVGDVELGKALRTARAISLFDEDKWNKQQMSDWDIELNRRIVVDCAQFDRFLSMHFLRAPTLGLQLNCSPPDYFADACYDMPSGKLNSVARYQFASAPFHTAKDQVSRGAYRTAEFLINFLRRTPLERYQKAREVDEYLEQAEMQAMGAELQYEVACNLANLTSPEAFRRACQSLVSYTSVRRQRCTVMRQFLLDREAPVELRVAALEHAKIIIETVPVLIAVSSSPWVAFSSSWCSGHLFCAASTFAIVYLGEEDQQEPSAELDWFASKIFEVLDILSVLGIRDRVAKRCEELLVALCTSRDTLREKFAASKSGKRQQKGLQQQESNSNSTSKARNNKRKSTNGNSRKETWPGFRSMVSMNDSGHVPVGILNVADAPSKNGNNQSHNKYIDIYNNEVSNLSKGTVSNSTTMNGNPLFSSPEAFATNTGSTPGGRSSGSRNSIAEETHDSNSSAWWVPPLDDGQWNNLINSLDGDWQNLIGQSNNAMTNAALGTNHGNLHLTDSMTLNASMPFTPL